MMVVIVTAYFIFFVVEFCAVSCQIDLYVVTFYEVAASDVLFRLVICQMDFFKVSDQPAFCWAQK